MNKLFDEIMQRFIEETEASKTNVIHINTLQRLLRDIEGLQRAKVIDEYILILKSKACLHPQKLENIRKNVLAQIPSGVVAIPEGIEIETMQTNEAQALEIYKKAFELLLRDNCLTDPGNWTGTLDELYEGRKQYYLEIAKDKLQEGAE